MTSPLCTLSRKAVAGALLVWLVSAGLATGYRESSPPFSFLGPDKRPVGYCIDSS